MMSRRLTVNDVICTCLLAFVVVCPEEWLRGPLHIVLNSDRDPDCEKK